ncbi:hypothetical protein [Flavobacterium sp.]|uniref:hypothetical protein n=1 Tax=Flavobacterium sp. TaxID=239 RepID=UPI003D13C69F
MKSIKGESAIITPTGHPNQIHKANERKPLPVVSQSLQIVHKFYRNLSCSWSPQPNGANCSQLAPVFYLKTY